MRLNLSKGGVGLSGGVTGARIGLSPRGAYVHGGRHGLYYRKYAPKGGRQEQRDERRAGEERYFVDTGLTYRPVTSLKERITPAAPVLKGSSGAAMALLGIGLLLAMIFFANGQSMYVISGMVMLTGGIVLNGRHLKNRENAQKLRSAIETALDEKRNVAGLLEQHRSNGLSETYRRWLDFHVFALFQDAFYSDPDYITSQEIENLEAQLMLTQRDKQALKAEAFADFLDELMADHVINREEEEQLEAVQSALRISDDAIAAEKQMIRQLCAFRDALESPLEAIETDISLKRNESCYHRCEGRLLREKIVAQYQRNRVVYKEIGYDIDLEGSIYLCSSRILIVERGSRSYALSRLLDVTLSLEDHTVQLTLDDRKNPLIFTTEDIATFAGKLQRMMDDKAQ